MKHIQSSFNKLFKGIILILVVIFCINLTTGADEKVSKEPEHVDLLEGEGSFNADIYDANKVINLTEFSFTGHTKIGGVKKEDDDSVNVLDLAKIKEIEIVKESYICLRYQDREYILATITSTTGVKTKGLLIPRKIVICGTEKKSDIRKAWYLKKIKKIVIKHPKILPPSKLTAEEISEESIFEKIKSGIKKAANIIDPTK